MMVVAEEAGASGHEIEPFVITGECAYVASTLVDLSGCFNIVGEPER
jgi:hypothetical protein